MISDQEAQGQVKEALDQARTPHGTVDNVMRVHSLRPHTMYGHTALYRSVLHHQSNALESWFLETAGTYTSILNRCDYSVTHHSSNLRRLISNDEQYQKIMSALREQIPESAFSGKELAMLQYVEKLTLAVGDMDKEDIAALFDVGCDDGEILELNQVVGYFSYVKSTVERIGCHD